MLSNLLEILSTFVLNTIESWGYFGIFFLSTLESANIPVPSEIILPFSGFLVVKGVFNFWTVVLMGAFGNLAGSLISYGIAVKFEARIKRNRDFVSAEKWFKRFGDISVFVSRLLPVVRTFVSFPAGVLRMNLWKFSILTFLGSFLWSWFLTYIGFFLGEKWNIIEPYFRKFDFAIVGVVGIGFIWLVWHHFKKRKQNG